jgi:hypothetical protein
MKRISFAIAAASLGLMGPASSAWAVLERNTFAGVVTVNNPLNGTPAIGSAFWGQFTLDSAILTGEGPNCAGRPNCWSGESASWSWYSTDYTLATVQIPISFAINYTRLDSAPGAGVDRLLVQLGGLPLTDVKLVLEDPTGSAFEAGGWGGFTQRTFSYAPLCLFGTCGQIQIYSGTLTSLVTTAVPEPGTAPMLLLGTAALVAAAWRRPRG